MTDPRRPTAVPPATEIDLTDAERDALVSPHAGGELVPLPRRSRRRTGADRRRAPLRRRPLGPQRAHARSSPAGSTTRSTSTGSGPSGRASSTCPKPAARCSSPTTPARSRPTRPAIMHGIETELGRPVYGLAENLFRSMPVVGTLWSRGGGVAAHPDNAYRLLHDEGQLVLVFPEGTKGTGKRYTRALPAAPLRPGRLRRDRDARRRAGRSRSRWSAPRSRCRSCSRAAGSRRCSASPTSRSPRTCCCSGPLGLVGYFPAKFQLRVLPPVHFDVAARPGALLAQPGDGRVGDASARRCRTRSTTCCARVAACGSGSARCASSSPGCRTYLGRPGRAGARAATRRRGRRRRRHHGPAHPARAHRVRAHRLVVLDPRPHRARDAGRHDPAHAPHRRLDARERPHAARDQRDRHDEPARGGGRVGQPGAQGRAQELAASSTAPTADRPVLLPRGDDAHERRRAPTSSGRCSRSRRSCATSPTTARTSTSRCCASPTCSATTSTRRSRRALRRPVVPEILGFDPRVQFVHEDDVVGALMYATTHDVPGVYNVGRRRQHAVERGVRDRRQAARRRCRRGSPTSRPNRCACCGSWDLPPESAACCCATAATSTTTAQARRLPLPVHDRGHRRGVRRGPAAREDDRRQATRRTATSARSRDFFRHSPAVVRDD